MLATLKTVHALGIADAEVFHARSFSTVFEYAVNEIRSKTYGIDDGIGIRVLKDGHVGFSYSSTKASVGEAVKTAAALSKFSAKSNFSFPEKQKYPTISAYDEKVAEANETEFKEAIAEIVDGIKKYAEPIRIVLVSEVAEFTIANTNLLFANQKSTSFSVYAECKHGDGFGFSSYSHYKMPSDFRELGERAGIMAKEMAQAGKLPRGKYSVIFSHEVLSSLMELLLVSFSGELCRRKISKLHDKQGQKVFDEKLSVWDDPLADGEGRSVFDGEGVASRKTTLIENGILRNFYFNRESAALANVEREGNCTRASYDAPPGLGPSNTVIGSGDAEPEAELKKYVLIESMHGLHTANPTSGDFGCEVSVAFLQENGMKKAVRGFMVSENIFNLFNKIEYIGKKQVQFGALLAPQISFRDIELIS